MRIGFVGASEVFKNQSFRNQLFSSSHSPKVVILYKKSVTWPPLGSDDLDLDQSGASIQILPEQRDTFFFIKLRLYLDELAKSWVCKLKFYVYWRLLLHFKFKWIFNNFFDVFEDDCIFLYIFVPKSIFQKQCSKKWNPSFFNFFWLSMVIFLLFLLFKSLQMSWPLIKIR